MPRLPPHRLVLSSLSLLMASRTLKKKSFIKISLECISRTISPLLTKQPKGGFWQWEEPLLVLWAVLNECDFHRKTEFRVLVHYSRSCDLEEFTGLWVSTSSSITADAITCPMLFFQILHGIFMQIQQIMCLQNHYFWISYWLINSHQSRYE